MNKFTKLILSGSLLVAPSYGATDFVIDADLDYTAGGTLNVNVDATLKTGNAINFGKDAIGTIASGKTLPNNGFIYYHEVVGTDPSSVTGVFRPGAGVIDQDYDAVSSKVKGTVYLDNISYDVKNGAMLVENTTSNELILSSELSLEQLILYEGYNGGKMTPDLAVLSAPIQYTKDGTTYTFGTQSSKGIIPDRIKVETTNDKAQFGEYLSEFGIEGKNISTSKTDGNSRIDVLAGTSVNQAVLIPDTIDDGDTVTIEMATDHREICGNLHNAGQSDTIKFTRPVGDVGLLTLSGNNSELKKTVEFGASEAGIPVKFSGKNSIPGEYVNCYGDVSTGDSGANLPGGAILTIKGNSISGQINASANSTINIGAPLP